MRNVRGPAVGGAMPRPARGWLRGVAALLSGLVIIAVAWLSPLGRSGGDTAEALPAQASACPTPPPGFTVNPASTPTQCRYSGSAGTVTIGVSSGPVCGAELEQDWLDKANAPSGIISIEDDGPQSYPDGFTWFQLHLVLADNAVMSVASRNYSGGVVEQFYDQALTMAETNLAPCASSQPEPPTTTAPPTTAPPTTLRPTTTRPRTTTLPPTTEARPSTTLPPTTDATPSTTVRSSTTLGSSSSSGGDDEGGDDQGGDVPGGLIAAGAAGAAAVAAGAAAAARARGRRPVPPGGGSGVPLVPDPSVAAGNGGAAANPRTEFSSATGSPGSQSTCGLPTFAVSTASRHLVVQDTVAAFGAYGPTIELAMTYNSPGARTGGLFGPAWASPLDPVVDYDGTWLTYWTGSGQAVQLPADGTAVDTPAASYRARVTTEAVEVIEGPVERTMTFALHPDGRWHCHRIADARGRAVTIRRGPAAIAVDDDDGRTLLLTLVDGRCTAARLPDGRTATFAYDATGRLVRAVDLAGIPTTYGYDPLGRLDRIDVGDGWSITRFAYEGATAEIAAVTDAVGAVTTYQRLAAGSVRITDPTGRAVDVDAVGTWTVRVSAGGRADYVASYEGGLLATVQTGAGTTTRTYEDRRLTRITTDHGDDVRYERTGGQVTGVATPVGLVRDEGDHAVVTRPDGVEARLVWDDHGELSRVVDPDGTDVLVIHRDRFGNVVATDDRHGRTTYRFDEHGLRLLSETGPDGVEVRYEWDANDRLIRLWSSDGDDVAFGYTPGALASITAQGVTTWYRQDGLLRVGAVETSTGRRRLVEHDAAGRPTAVVGPDGRRATQTWDPAGQLARLVTPDGVEHTFAYDAWRRLVAVTTAGTMTTRYERDEAGRIVARHDPWGGVTRWEHGPDGRVVRVVRPSGAVVTPGPAPTPTDGPATTATDDPEHRTVLVQWDGGWCRQQVDGFGAVVTTERSNSVPSHLVLDAERFPVRLVHGSDGELADVTFEWDAGERLVREAGTVPLEADGAPPARPRVVVDPGGRLLTVDGHAVDHDADGNVAAIPGRCTAGHTPRGELAWLEDGSGRTELRWAGGQLVGLHRDGGEERLERDAAGRVVRWTDADGRTVEYVHGLDGPVARIVDGATQFFHWGRTGNLLAVTDAAGEVVAALDLDAHGRVLARTGDPTLFGFQGQYGVVDLGGDRYVMGLRVYDAAIGRFLEPDPLDLAGGPDRYDFADGVPVNRVDPDGLDWQEWVSWASDRWANRHEEIPEAINRVAEAVRTSRPGRMAAEWAGRRPTPMRVVNEGLRRFNQGEDPMSPTEARGKLEQELYGHVQDAASAGGPGVSGAQRIGRAAQEIAEGKVSAETVVDFGKDALPHLGKVGEHGHTLVEGIENVGKVAGGVCDLRELDRASRRRAR